MNIGFASGGIFMAHSLYKTPRKPFQCVMAWLVVYIFWIGASVLLDLWLLGRPSLPGLTHERICMFIGPAAAVVYRYLFPQLSMWNCVFTYFMVNNCLILMLLFARTLSEVLAAALALPVDGATLVLYHGKHVDRLCQRLREGFQGENCPEFYGISIGRAILKSADQLEETLNEADRVMYEEKMSRKRSDPEDALPAL